MLERLGKREPTALYTTLILERLGKREPTILYETDVRETGEERANNSV